MRSYVLAVLGCLVLLSGCGDSSPTPPPVDQTLQLRVTANFVPVSPFAAVIEAAVLLDGAEIGRRSCPNLPGCTPMVVNANTSSTTKGSHNLEFQLISHSFNILPSNRNLGYTLSGTVEVLRSGSVVQQIQLTPKNVQLGPGDKSGYSINVNP